MLIESSSVLRDALPASPPRVLLAEDDDDIRRLLKCALLMEGYEVAEARDGVQLLCYVASIAVDELLPPDFIITDVRMPGFTGLDALRAAGSSGLDAPIVLITAFCDDHVRAEALRHGAAALLKKPLAIDELLLTLAALRHREAAVAEDDGSC